MGGPPISEYAKRILIEVYLEYIDRGDTPSAKEVLIKAKKRLEEAGDTRIRLPKLRKAQEILREFRIRQLKRTNEEKSRDYPWSLGLLVDMDIPPEAVPAVLRVWKLCMISGGFVSLERKGQLEVHERALTAREAKWVSRLHEFIPNTHDLMMWSRAYAVRERVCEVNEMPCDTTDLDNILALSAWEWATTYLVKKASPYNVLGIPARSCPQPFESHDSSVIDLAQEAEKLFLLRSLEDTLYEDEHELSDLSELEFGQEAMWIYTSWLWYLYKGPKCSQLSMQKRMEIIKELRGWVKDHPWIRYAAYLPIDRDMSKKILADSEVLRPLELIRAVGYED